MVRSERYTLCREVRGGGRKVGRWRKWAREGEKGGSACLIWNGCYSDHTPACQLWHGSLLHPAPKWQIKDTPQWPSSLSSSPLALSLSPLVFSSHPSLQHSSKTVTAVTARGWRSGLNQVLNNPLKKTKESAILFGSKQVGLLLPLTSDGTALISEQIFHHATSQAVMLALRPVV